MNEEEKIESSQQDGMTVSQKEVNENISQQETFEQTQTENFKLETENQPHV